LQISNKLETAFEMGVLFWYKVAWID
jgi:hypothetical protein